MGKEGKTPSTSESKWTNTQHATIVNLIARVTVPRVAQPASTSRLKVSRLRLKEEEEKKGEETGKRGGREEGRSGSVTSTHAQSASEGWCTGIPSPLVRPPHEQCLQGVVHGHPVSPLRTGRSLCHQKGLTIKQVYKH